jgi:hypothetical protein
VDEPRQPSEDPAAEAERAWTPRTPARALTGVWLTVAATVVVVLILIVVALSLT